MQEGQLEKAKRFLWLRCATDKELFALRYFPHYCRLQFNELHRDQFRSTSFCERSVRRARAAPRGYAKSTLETLVEPIHDVCYGIEKFIVIFSNTEVQSSQKLADIRTEILTNHRLAADYRISLASKRSAQSSYVLVCGEHRCLLQGYGANTEVRGIRFGSDRPSKIILDDAEHSEEVLNEAIRTKYEDWYNQVVSKLGDTQTNIKIVGTILHPESLLANKIRNPAFDGKIYKAVINWSPRQDLWNTWTKIYTNLDDPDRRAKADAFYAENESAMLDGTKVLWPEKESYLYLMKELIETGKRAFYKEKQNEPIGGVTALFENIAYYQERSDGFLIEATDKLIPWSQLKDREGRWLGSFGALDPATGQTKAKAGKLGDYNCILTGMAQPIPGREHKLRLFVHHDWTQREGPSRTFSQVFDQDEIFDYSKFAVETNLYRDLMLPNLEAERKRQMEKNKRDLRVPFYDVEAVENKEKRIYTLEPKVTHSWILFNRALSPTFMRQVEAFPFGDHDDGPDALEMLWGLVNGRYKPSPLSLNQGGR